MSNGFQPLTVGAVETAARDRHLAFDLKRVPPGLVVRFLSDEQRRLMAEVYRRNPDWLTQEFTQSVAQATFDTPITLPPFLGIVNARVTFSDDTGPIPLTINSSAMRGAPIGRYTAVVQGNVLTLLGTSADWPATLTGITLDYVPLPLDLAALTDTLTLPLEAKSALVERLAEFMARRLEGAPDTPPIDLMAFSARAAQAEGAFLDMVQQQRAAYVTVMREG